MESHHEEELLWEAERAKFRDTYGIESFWDATWDLSFSILGLMYNYQQGYYFYHFGHSIGAGLADMFILTDWFLNYPAMQQMWALTIQNYTDAWEERREEIEHSGPGAADHEHEAEEGSAHNHGAEDEAAGADEHGH